MTETQDITRFTDALREKGFRPLREEDLQSSSGSGKKFLQRLWIEHALTGRVLLIEATKWEDDDVRGYLGSIIDPTDDDSTEFDYIDSVGTNYDAAITGVIRQLTITV